MRVLLDENIPVDLAALLTGHDVQTVSGLHWQGLKNGELLGVRAGASMPSLRWIATSNSSRYSQIGHSVVLLGAPSNRITHLQPLVPALLEALKDLEPGQIVRVGV